MAQGLPVFPAFSVSEPGVDTRWRKWTGRFENLMIGMDIKDKKRQRALLLHYAGEEAKQESNENIDSFHTRLRHLSINCEFSETDKEIKSQIIQGCTSTRLRRKALRDDLTLDSLIKEARTLELSDQQASEIEGQAKYDVVNAMKSRQRKNQKAQKERRRHIIKESICRYCGYEYPHKSGKCPASGKTCTFCSKKNHFEAVCLSKKRDNNFTYKLNDSSQSESDKDKESEDENEIYGLSVNSMQLQRPRLKVHINGCKIKALIDTGSSINVIDENTYSKLQNKVHLKRAHTKVYAYGASKVTLLGKFQAQIESKNKITTAPVYVTKGTSGNLLSYQTSVDLNIIPEINTVTDSKVDELCKKYQTVFTGMGKMKATKVKLYVDKNVQPVTQPHRRIPFHLRKQVENELQRLEDLDIIEKVEGPTDWVSPIVLEPKPKTNQIRICVDMRLPNQAIKRTRHIIPTIDDMIVDLSGAKVFSKLDLNHGYHQLELSEESRNITTFTTHVGLRRYKRLSFGINSAAEIFQNALSTALEGLNGVRNISDDVIIWAGDQAEHDRRLEAVLKRLEQKNLTLNKSKCEFNKQKLEFFGYIFSKDGMSADPKKIETINKTQPPKTVSEVRSFLAMTNYVSRFIPNYSTIAEPIRRLIKKNAKWAWQNEQDEAFNKLKSILSSDTVMTYFDPNKETQIITDASPVGVAAIMLQEGKVVCYASRSLTDVERSSYSQQEKENLALVWSLEHWHIYLFGHKFTVITDAKFLENIYNNPKSKLGSARLERWRMRLLSYDSRIVHKHGESNMSDYLSRHPDTGQGSKSSIAEEYVSFLVYHDVPVAMNMNEIIQATSSTDNDLQMAIKSIKTGCWSNTNKNKVFDTFSRCKNELSVVNLKGGEILLHESRIVIPRQLQDKAISLAHEGHQGIVKNKQLLREKVYFPGMDQQVENMCKSCILCLAATNSKQHEPLNMSDMPKYPFQMISLDFCGPFPDEKYLLVLIDEYLRFPFVEVLNSITGNTVIPVLDKIFSETGIPEIPKSDNGSPMNSHLFKSFAKHLGFKHRKITPLWPQANAECERFMKTIGKSIRASHVHHTNWKQDMYAFLRNYRFPCFKNKRNLKRT
ncbi:uncharacterized protein K02A2.6-like [Ruditapes philippinarum]|uniref:uncharacterized protein K02A2.6-like n=1 Tax=Ruditapes philippinarum TaxID=129788 RepID=UPI00295BAA15|nr:uncharacterized protein K02A2.6-like [Ruditapes philippinarum]